MPVSYFMKDKVLIFKWRPPVAAVEDEWKVVYQIVVPEGSYEPSSWFANGWTLRVNKIYNRILTHFYWLNIRRDLAEYCRSCHTCQVVGKPNKKKSVAPIWPMPAFEEPFSRVIVDCVGPLPKTTSGNQYIFFVNSNKLQINTGKYII